MALSCPCQMVHSGQVLRRKIENAAANTCFGPSICHVSERLPSCCGLAFPNSKLVLVKTWYNSRVGFLRWNREGSFWHYRDPRALHRDPAQNSFGTNCSGTGNGAMRSMAFTSPEKVDSNVEDDAEGKTSANNASNGSAVKKSARRQTDDIITLAAARVETISLVSNTRGVPDWSTASGVRNSCNLHDGLQEQDEEFLESEKEPCVSLVWEAGSEIERVRTERASLQDGKYVKECNFSLIEDAELGEEESHLGVKTPQQVSDVGAVWLNLQGVTQRSLWVTKDDNTFDSFFQNMSKIQQKIWLMMTVHGKLVWTRFRQLLSRRLRALEEILATFPGSEEDLDREGELLAVLDKIMNQSAVNQDDYESTQEALIAAEGMVFQLNTQVVQLKKDLASQDGLLRLLHKEASLSSESFQRAAQSLSDAERRIIDLERRAQLGEEALHIERDRVTAAVRSAVLLEQAAKAAENKVTMLTSEISSLKILVESKDKIELGLREDRRRNANVLLSAAKTHEALNSSRRKVEHLSAQVSALEEEIKSRDSLLLEIKNETIRRTEALKLAAQIKLDLNATRQREVQLTQALESANDTVKELQAELLENLRALRAEQALKKMEKMLRESRQEVELLRSGIEARDKALCAMKNEMDLHISLLSNAAQNREELETIKHQKELLSAELGSKDAKLRMMREEMASVIDLARHKQSGYSGTSNSNHFSSPAAKMANSKKKSQSHNQSRTQQTS